MSIQTEQFIISPDGTVLKVLLCGQGEPLLFLHGWAMGKEYFSEQIKALGMTRQVIVPDLRGMGSSGNAISNEKVTLRDYANDLHTIIRSLNLRSVTLVGWSFGAFVAWEYLNTYGTADVEALFVVEMIAYLGDPSWANVENEAIGKSFGQYLETFFDSMFVIKPSESTRQQLLSISHKTTADLAIRLNLLMAEHDYRPIVQKLTIPTMFVYGEQNLFFDDEQKKSTCALVRGSALHLIVGAKHCPFLEQPEAFNDLLTRFIEKL